jgi:hypothetical protein
LWFPPFAGGGHSFFQGHNRMVQVPGNQQGVFGFHGQADYRDAFFPRLFGYGEHGGGFTGIGYNEGGILPFQIAGGGDLEVRIPEAGTGESDADKFPGQVLGGKPGSPDAENVVHPGGPDEFHRPVYRGNTGEGFPPGKGPAF